jgi:hypothetical protein
MMNETRRVEGNDEESVSVVESHLFNLSKWNRGAAVKEKPNRKTTASSLNRRVTSSLVPHKPGRRWERREKIDQEKPKPGSK